MVCLDQKSIRDNGGHNNFRISSTKEININTLANIRRLDIILVSEIALLKGLFRKLVLAIKAVKLLKNNHKTQTYLNAE